MAPDTAKADIELGHAMAPDTAKADETGQSDISPEGYPSPSEMLHTAVINCGGEFPTVGLFLQPFENQLMEDAFQALQTKRRCFICLVGCAAYALFVWIFVILDAFVVLDEDLDTSLLYLIPFGTLLSLMAAGMGLWWKYSDNYNYKIMYKMLVGVYIVFLVQSATTAYMRYHKTSDKVTEHGLLMQGLGLVRTAPDC